MISELLITIYFWAVLYTQADASAFSDKLFAWAMYIIHSVPLFCLIVDDIFLNSLGIFKRHYSAVFAVTLAYLIVNMSVALSVGPVYPGMTWKDLVGIALPLGLVLVSMLIFYLACLISLFKLKSLDQMDFVKIFILPEK